MNLGCKLAIGAIAAFSFYGVYAYISIGICIFWDENVFKELHVADVSQIHIMAWA